MKRYGTLALLLFFISLMTAYMVSAREIKGSKHDLSMPVADEGTGPGPIQSAGGATGTKEICVFCHTPHSARPDAPLWNRSMATGPYTVYSSDILDATTGLGIIADDPSNSASAGYAVHVKTRICLSCHDGTIALGSLVNMPGDLVTITINNSNVGKIPNTAAGYLGKDLSDDHPVAIKQVWTGLNSDPELKSPAGTRVRLYNNVGGRIIAKTTPENGDYVECTSCHDAHDSQYGNFLVGPNDGSKLCLNCHTKSLGAIAKSAHDNATNPDYGPSTYALPPNPDKYGAKVADVKCMTCHYSHRAGATGAASPFNENPGYGKYLLSFQEDNTCFNNPNRWGESVSVCHASNTTNASGRYINIETQMSKPNSAHSAGKNASYSGKHGAMEQGNGAPSSLPKFANTHVVCADCHNPHTAGNGALHTAGTNTINTDSSLYGVGGVQFTGNPGWVALNTGNFNAFEPLGATTSISWPLPHYEYEICLKCHSAFAWGGGSGPSISDLPNLTTMTDQAKELNIGNAGYHTVMGSKNPSSYTPPAASWANGWAATSLMYCSDCHGNNTNFTEAQGPHGSTNAGILVKPFTDSYDNISKSNPQPQGELCAQCHKEDVYNNLAPSVTDNVNNGTGFLSTNGYNLHNAHKYRAANAGVSTYSYRCVNCHVRIPHGYTRRGMVVVSTDAGPTGDASVYATGGAAGAKITNFTQPLLQTYGTTTAGSGCSTVAGCHHP